MYTNTNATVYLDHGYNIITGQVVECMDCSSFWSYIPMGFIYDDYDGGWRQDAMAPYVAGHCKACAAAIVAADREDHDNGNWAMRDMEDERYAA